MIERVLGRMGLRVSAVSFGAGPVSGLFTGDNHDLQHATVDRALQIGINWFDTAPGYGNGKSEANLGRVIEELQAKDRVLLATKVRIPADSFTDVAEYVRRSVEESLQRLRVPRVTLLQLHNGITRERGDEPASAAVADVLGPRGIAAAFRELHHAGLIQHTGLTGTGHADAIRDVIRSNEFDTLQVPFNMLNPSAAGGSSDGEADYGNLIADCSAMGMGVFAIRVFAGGALLDQPPSAHTLKTPFFPLALFLRDQKRAERLRKRVASRLSMAESAVRFALAHPAVSSAIIGFGSPAHVDEVARMHLEEGLPDLR